ncbi:MAG: hypothetical protein ACFFE8_14965 [Candidatus Heimdallarchaeota archaeon]
MASIIGPDFIHGKNMFYSYVESRRTRKQQTGLSSGKNDASRGPYFAGPGDNT